MSSSGTPHGSSSDPTPEPPTPQAEQPSLLEGFDEPVPFALTARARRVVAPASLPPLAVVAPADTEPSPSTSVPNDVQAAAEAGTGQPAQDPNDEDDVPKDEDDPEDDLDDPRRARARALRRAGADPSSVARELQVDLMTVARWTDDVTAAPAAVRRARAVEHREHRELPAAYVTGRAAARAAWRRGRPAIGAAMVAGLAEVTPFAVRLRGELATVGGVLQWLRDSQAIDDRAVRVHVRVAPDQARDRVAHDVAGRLQLDARVVEAHPWSQAPDPDAIEVTVRIGDPRLAGTIAGWRERLLEALGEDLAGVDLGDDVAAVAG